MRALLDAGIYVKLNCSLTPENAADLDWIVDYAKERGTVLAVVTYMFPPIRRDLSQIGVNERFTPEESAQYLMRYLRRQRGEEAYQYYLQRVLDGYIDPPGLDEGCIDPLDGKIRCRAGKATFWITWDGWLTPCGMMPEPKVDAAENTFAENWKQLTEVADNLRLSGVCDKCPNQDVCHPCAAMAFAETGTFSGIPEYLCRSTQEMFRIAKRDLNPKEE